VSKWLTKCLCDFKNNTDQSTSEMDIVEGNIHFVSCKKNIRKENILRRVCSYLEMSIIFVTFVGNICNVAITGFFKTMVFSRWRERKPFFFDISLLKATLKEEYDLLSFVWCSLLLKSFLFLFGAKFGFFKFTSKHFHTTKLSFCDIENVTIVITTKKKKSLNN
jgi:hypothetical protein